jgi:thiamine biosynthesis lipoprotein ApbE
MRSFLQHFPVTLALVAMLCVSGCAGKKQSPLDKMQEAFADVRTEIQASVTDPERAAQAVELVDQLEQTYVDTTASIQSHKDQLRELNEDYDVSRAAMEEPMALILVDLEVNQKVVLEIGNKMSALLTAEEKDELAKARSKALSAAVNTMNAT